jgi:hypothetical protein
MLLLFLEHGNTIFADDNQSILLHKAYKNNSREMLIRFCENWYREYPVKKRKNITKEEKVYYDIFQMFYNPLQLNNYGECAMFDSLYKGYSYFIVQSTIAKFCNNKEIRCTEYNNDECCISDFRPDLNIKNVKCLFFTSKYQQILIDFLGVVIKDSVGVKQYIYNADDSESLKRFTFIRNVLPIEMGHSHTNWYFITGPEIHIIFEDDKEDERTIPFSLLHCIGYATVKYDKRHWKFKESNIRGME